jgi:DNA-binding CsgD family transcriptional regulator
MHESLNYHKDIANTLKHRNVKNTKPIELKEIPLVLRNQALYIIDWKKFQIVYTNGIFELLGYTKEEFDLELIVNCIHPEDIAVVNRIKRGIVNLAIHSDLNIQKPYLNITFRLLKKDGTYIKVLRQSSTHQTDEEGQLISSMSILTDISFINTASNIVEWELSADTIDVNQFKQNIYKEFVNFFTPRELEIISLIENDFTNNKIAEKLFISAHTVVTHRKNILKKSNCHNSKQLIKFCRRNHIL